MGIEALYTPSAHDEAPEPGHKIFPYLLRGVEITRPNQVWAMDITYIPMAKGFVYLAVVLDCRLAGGMQRAATGRTASTADIVYHVLPRQMFWQRPARCGHVRMQLAARRFRLGLLFFGAADVRIEIFEAERS